MPHELVYTSVPRGLRAGSTGFCTVAQTPGISDALAEQLVALSGYRHLTIGGDPEVSGNPVVYSHTVAIVGQRTYHVVSRIADTGLDHTDRSNHLAHHVAFLPEELPQQGPAWVCQNWPFEKKWIGAPRVLPTPQGPAGAKAKLRKCLAWEAATGDAGWAGRLAAATNPTEPAYLVCPSGLDVLPLVAESLSLLAAQDRWNVTFSTFYTRSAATGCQWRCVRVGSAEAKSAVARSGGLVLQLDKPRPAAEPPSGPLAEAARTGVAAKVPPRPVQALSLTEYDQSDDQRVYVPDSFTVPPPPAVPKKKEVARAEEDDAPPPASPLPERVRERERVPRPTSSAAGIRLLLLGLGIGVVLALVPSAIIGSKLKKDLTTERAALAERETQVKVEKTKLEERDKLLADEKNATKKLSDDLVKKEKALKDESTERAKAEEAFKNVDKALKDQNPRLASAIKELGEVKGKLTKTDETLTAKTNELNNANTALTGKMNELNNANKELGEVKGKLTAAADALKAETGKLKAAETELMDVKGKLKTAEAAPKFTKPEEDYKKEVAALDLQLKSKPIPSYAVGVPIPLDLKKPGMLVRLPERPGRLVDALLPPEFDSKAGTGPGAVLEIRRKDSKVAEADAKIEVKPGGEVFLTGAGLERYPKLSLAVLRVTPGLGLPPVYYQFFHPIATTVPPGVGIVDPAKKDESRYGFELKPRVAMDEPQMKELLAATETALVPGAAARVRFHEKEYDLLPVADNALEYQQGPLPTDFKIRLVVDKGKVVVVASGTLPKSDKPLECQILALDLGRKIEVTGGPVVWQEVFRIR